jgi:hypothetical protein
MMVKNAFHKGLVVLLGIVVLSGCGKGKSNQRNPTEDRLYKIGKAYIQACYRLERAPENFGDIKSSIEGDVPDDLLVSPNDGENFVILWGVNFAELSPSAKDPFTVGGYEKKGVDGTRYVLRFPLSTVKMTDEAFQAAIFPPGYNAPR